MLLLTTQSMCSKTEQLAVYTDPYIQLGFKLHLKHSPLNSEQAVPLGHDRSYNLFLGTTNCLVIVFITKTMLYLPYYLFVIICWSRIYICLL